MIAAVTGVPADDDERIDVSGAALGRMWSCWVAASPHLHEQLTDDDGMRAVRELDDALTDLMRSGSGDHYLFFDL
jgi:hypothetical protein